LLAVEYSGFLFRNIAGRVFETERNAPT
jgi:hypothetical protein